MESLYLKQLISSTHNTYSVNNPLLYPVHIRRISTQIQQFSFLSLFKKVRFSSLPQLTMFQFHFSDFHTYAKPSRLLPPTEVIVCPDSSLEKVLTSFKFSGSDALYKVKVETSSSYGSGLTVKNTGVLICVIDENGDSILQKIPAISAKDHTMSDDKAFSDVLHFQRGSVDDFTFEGPKLGKIEAVWISVESGHWRLGGMNLTVISKCQPLSERNNLKDSQCVSCEYEFEAEDILLGDKSDVSMAELRPSKVSEFSGDKLALLGRNTSQSNCTRSNEESMKEDSDLKLSLLLHHSMLILTGILIAFLSTGENTALAFLTGGIGGFLYLLLLQRSVDGLPAADTITLNEAGTFDHIFQIFKGRVTTLVVVAFAAVVIAVRYSSADNTVAFTPKELMFGLMGFLMCKVSALLAAFRPIPKRLKNNK